MLDSLTSNKWSLGTSIKCYTYNGNYAYYIS